MKSRFLVLVAVSASVSLAGCSPNVLSTGAQQTETMGNAQPATSPASSQPDGEVVEYEPVHDLDVAVTDASEEVIGLRADNKLLIGDLDAFRSGEPKEIVVEPEGADITANDGRFALVRPSKSDVTVIDAAAPESTQTFVPVDDAVTVAAPLLGGGLLAGSAEKERVWVYSDDGTELDTFRVARPSDFLLAHSYDQIGDRAIRGNRFDTTIQDLQVDRGRQGGTLRAGLGVGKAAFGDDGLVLAADATGNRLLVYTTDEVIRLHQMVPTDGRPWAVAWDPARELAWITSTEDNTVTGYDISQGVPVERHKFNTVADAQSLIALGDGTLIIGSATGDGLQVIPPDTGDTDNEEATGEAKNSDHTDTPTSES